MTTSLFVSIPTADLPRAKAFFEALGWSINPNFSPEEWAAAQF